MGKGLGQRRLAVAAGTAQRGGDRDGITFGVEQLLFQRIKFLGPRNKTRRRLGRHPSNALLQAFALEDADQRRFVLGYIEVVDLAEPARQFTKVFKTRPFDWADRLALLTCQPNLTSNRS